MGALAVAFSVLRSSAGASPTPPAALATSTRISCGVEHQSIDRHGPGGCDGEPTGRTAPSPRRGRAADDDGAAGRPRPQRPTARALTSSSWARLADAGAGVTLWVERVHVQPGALFNAENVIAERVVRGAAAAPEPRAGCGLRGCHGQRRGLRRIPAGRAALVTYTPDGTRRAIESVRAGARSRPRLCPGPGRTGHGVRRHVSPLCPGGGGGGKRGNRAEAEARAALAAADDGLAEKGLGPRGRGLTANSTGSTPRWTPPRAQCSIRTWMSGAFFQGGRLLSPRLHGGGAHRAGERPPPPRADVGRADANRGARRPLRGQFAPARARLEEVSRLSSRAIGDTYLALAYHTPIFSNGRTRCWSPWRRSRRPRRRRGPARRARPECWPRNTTTTRPAARSNRCSRVRTGPSRRLRAGGRLRTARRHRTGDPLAAHRRRHRVPMRAVVRARPLAQADISSAGLRGAPRLHSNEARRLALGQSPLTAVLTRATILAGHTASPNGQRG